MQYAQLITWFVVNTKDRCKLFCRVATSTAYYQLAERVIDGTKCGPDTSDVCVMGQCRVRSNHADLNTIIIR